MEIIATCITKKPSFLYKTNKFLMSFNSYIHNHIYITKYVFIIDITFHICFVNTQICIANNVTYKK